MSDRVHAAGDERGRERRPGGKDEPPATSTREHEERGGEQRAQQATAGVRVRDEAEEHTDEDTWADPVPLESCRALEHEEQQDDEERLRRRLDGHPAELEEPGREAGEHEDDPCDDPALLTRQTSSASRRTAARTSTVESPRATDWLGPVSSNTPASRYG